MSKQRVLVVNDTHVGSVWGLWPPIYETHGGTKIGANAMQLQLWKKWKKFLGEIKRLKIDTLMLLGDLIDGSGYRSQEGEHVSTDLNEQVTCASMILADLKEAIQPTETYLISGTDYHSKSTKQMDNERQIAKDIGAKYLGAGPFVFNFGDTNIIFLHGTGSAYWYRASKMDRVDFARKLQMTESQLYNAACVVQGHLHFQGHLEYRYSDVYISPCWQVQTDYARKKDAFKMIPDIGSLMLEIKNDKISHRWFGYEHPPRPIVEVKGHSLRPDNWPKFDIKAAVES